MLLLEENSTQKCSTHTHFISTMGKETFFNVSYCLGCSCCKSMFSAQNFSISLFMTDFSDKQARVKSLQL